MAKFCCFFISDEEMKERYKSRQIDKSLSKERGTFRRIVRILLLGAGESGKSTFLKQMKIIHGQEFSEEEMIQFREVIYSNVVRGMRALIDAKHKLEIPWHYEEEEDAVSCAEDEMSDLDTITVGSVSVTSSKTTVTDDHDEMMVAINKKDERLIRAFEASVKIDAQLFAQYVEPIRRLWEDSGIQETYRRRREFQLADSFEYFMNNLDRLAAEAYRPSSQDILHAREATRNITEHLVSVRGIPILFIDVGGQRSQRQKWYQCFQDVTSILFLTGASEYDQVLMEDCKTNRLLESCDVFENIINNKAFVNVSVILFINKMDLLQKKIQTVNIKDFFREFGGNPTNIEDVKGFLLILFDSRRKDQKKPLFYHFTTAVDTENIKHVFQDVKETILQDNLRNLFQQ